MFISIVVPAYNEEKAIEQDLRDIIETMDRSSYQYEVIVVDDASKDKTAEIVKKFENVKLVQHKRNKGSGGARKTGIRVAKGDIIVMTDADGTYPNKDIPRLLEHFPECDMVVGARTSEQGSWKFLRAPVKWFIRKLASYIAGYNIPDLNSGFRAFKKDIAVKFFNILPNTHSWVSTITLAFLCNDYTVEYIPIEYYKRKGKSSFRFVRDTWTYIMLVIYTVMYFNPLKFFLPFTFLLLGTGLGRAIYHGPIQHGRIKESDITIFLTGIIVGVLGLIADLIVKQNKQNYVKTQPL